MVMLLVHAAKLHAYELTVQKSIRDVVTHTIPTKLLRMPRSSPAATVCAAVHVLTRLNAKWLEIERAVPEGGDAIPSTKRLHWFLAAILDHMDPALTQKWIIQMPTTRREVHSYADWPTFQQNLGALLATEVHGRPEDLLHDIDTMMGPVANYPNVATFLANLQEFRVAGQEFVRLRQAPATDRDVDRHILAYLAARLTDTARAALSDMLALQPSWRSTADAFYTEKYPPLEAYPLDSLLQALHERGLHRKGLNWTHDFKAQTLGTGGQGKLPSFSQGNRQRAPLSGMPGTGTTASGGTTPSLQPDTRPGSQASRGPGTLHNHPPSKRTIKVDGQPQDFPYHLRFSKLFVDLTVRDVVCHHCHHPGHTSFVCPKYFQLDEHLVEHNQRSFFYMLRPPQRVLNLRTRSVLAVHTGQPSAPSETPPWAARLLVALENLTQPPPSAPTAPPSIVHPGASHDARPGGPTIPRYDFTGLPQPPPDAPAPLNG